MAQFTFFVSRRFSGAQAFECNLMIAHCDSLAPPPSIPPVGLGVIAMDVQVAVRAQGDQVLLRRLAAKLLVMNLQVLQAPARLTSPSIPLQDFSPELLIRFGMQSQARLLRSNLTHDAF
jgi:hypothetical protein